MRAGAHCWLRIFLLLIALSSASCGLGHYSDADVILLPNEQATPVKIERSRIRGLLLEMDRETLEIFLGRLQGVEPSVRSVTVMEGNALKVNVRIGKHYLECEKDNSGNWKITRKDRLAGV